MLPIFCFIDDSQFELDVFAAHVAPAAPNITFILDTTYESVYQRLQGRYPCLFLLDLYGKDSRSTAGKIPVKADLEARCAGFPTLDQVYRGLEDFPGDRVNEYLKRLFQVADSWRTLFYRASRMAGQSTGYGLENLAAARRDFPAAAAVAYTRKSLITDAVEAFQAGVDGLNLKPNGPTDQEIRQATDEQAPRLIQAWSDLVDRRFQGLFRELSLELARGGLFQETEYLDTPGRLSGEAREVLGAEQVRFLEEAAVWRGREG